MSDATIINLNSTTPTTPAGSAPVKWQGDDNTNPRNVSAYVEPATGTEPGSIQTAADLGGTGSAPVVVGIQTIPVVIDKVPAQGDVLNFDLAGGDPNTGIGGRFILSATETDIGSQLLINGVLSADDALITFNSDTRPVLINGA